jgi:hypothetical protein
VTTTADFARAHVATVSIVEAARAARRMVCFTGPAPRLRIQPKAEHYQTRNPRSDRVFRWVDRFRAINWNDEATCLAQSIRNRDCIVPAVESALAGIHASTADRISEANPNGLEGIPSRYERRQFFAKYPAKLFEVCKLD